MSILSRPQGGPDMVAAEVQAAILVEEHGCMLIGADRAGYYVAEQEVARALHARHEETTLLLWAGIPMETLRAYVAGEGPAGPDRMQAAYWVAGRWRPREAIQQPTLEAAAALILLPWDEQIARELIDAAACSHIAPDPQARARAAGLAEQAQERAALRALAASTPEQMDARRAAEWARDVAPHPVRRRGQGRTQPACLTGR